MLENVNYILPQGVPLQAACIEINSIDYEIVEAKKTNKSLHIVAGVMAERECQTDDLDAEVSSIRFTARIWASRALKEQGRPHFEFIKDNKSLFSFDFAQHPDLADYLASLPEEMDTDKAIESVCYQFIKTKLL